MSPTITYRLRRRASAPSAAPMLDTSQQAVVAHAGGPLLVLAGPGTGKTTTMVEAIVDVVEHRGVRPDQVLALTFSRKAAEQLRDRVTTRLGRTLGTPLAATFHSFAYSLVRAHAATDAYTAPLRLLSSAQQDVVLQDLLQPSPEAVRWPPSLAEAVRARGFAREVQLLLDRARERGLSGADLVRAGAAAGRPEWEAAGRFLEDYLTILDAQSSLDYADLVVRAGALAADPEIQRGLRQRYSWVFVDEYQDTDPSQVALLQSIAGDGRNLVVVGDPDQSIYGFRGAEVRGILDFPAQFPTRSGDPAPVLALQTARRFGPRLLAASRGIATSIPVTGSIPADAFAEFRAPVPVEGDFGAGELDVVTFDTARAEVEHIADRLRRAHLEDGMAWSDMAVLVRSGRTTIPALRRSLTAAGVPVEVAGDDTPVVREPAVLPLLDGLAAALNLDNEAVGDPDYLDTDRAAELLTSPLGGLDAAELRALARELRRRERRAAAEAGRPPVPSPQLVRGALLDPGSLADVEGRGAAKAARLGGLLQETRSQLDAGATAEEALWTLWSGTAWPRRLRQAATSGGPGSVLAHRDLDAVCALFEEAARAEEQREHTGVASFLATLSAQQIPADTLAERGVRGAAVRLLTAHRSKGLEWRYVVVAHAQEEVWPDLRRRSSLLHADELPSPALGDGPLPPLSRRALLAEERRLFYVACTRARQRLLVTAVASPDDDGEQPSRFLAELGEPVQHAQGRPRRPLSLPGLVAELRRTVADPASSEPLRTAAARRLAALATTTVDAQPLAPPADPAHWWGTRRRSRSEQPLRDPEEPLRISASALEALLACPAHWFLRREAGGQEAATSSQGFGKIVHAVADRVAQGEVADLASLMELVDQVWGQMVFRTPWAATREREQIEQVLARFLAWHHRPGARTVIGTETELEAEVTVAGETVRLYGFADRLELDEDGRVVVVDLKTGKGKPTDEQVSEHAQLGLYQHAVAHGAADHLVEGGARLEAGGAELVQLRHEAYGKVKVQAQPPPEPGDDGLTLIEAQLAEAVDRLRSEELPAIAGPHCDHCGFLPICPIKGAGTVLST